MSGSCYWHPTSSLWLMLMQWTPSTLNHAAAVTLANNILVPVSNINSSINPSLLPGATNLPTRILSGSSKSLYNRKWPVFISSLFIIPWQVVPYTEGVIMLLPVIAGGAGTCDCKELSCDSTCMKWNSTCPTLQGMESYLHWWLWLSCIIITLCAYAQQGYAFGRVGLCAYVRTYVYKEI